MTELPIGWKTIEVRPGTSHTVKVEHPVEIALKKLNYRGSTLKIRDVFDIVVVDSLFPDLLHDNLHYVAHPKRAICDRLFGISEEFLRQQLHELAIADHRPLASTCLQRMKEIAQAIPDPN